MKINGCVSVVPAEAKTRQHGLTALVVHQSKREALASAGQGGGTKPRELSTSIEVLCSPRFWNSGEVFCIEHLIFCEFVLQVPVLCRIPIKIQFKTNRPSPSGRMSWTESSTRAGGDLLHRLKLVIDDHAPLRQPTQGWEESPTSSTQSVGGSTVGLEGRMSLAPKGHWSRLRLVGSDPTVHKLFDLLAIHNLEIEWMVVKGFRHPMASNSVFRG